MNISSMQSTPLSNQSIPTFETTLTNAKTQKVAHALFALIALLFANSFCALGGVAVLISFPLYVVSVLLAVRLFQIKDYSDPEKLKSYRETASHQTFQQTIDSYGLENVLLHEIYSPQLFRQKLKDHLPTLSPVNCVSLHGQLTRIVNNLHSPDLHQEMLNPLFEANLQDSLKRIPIVPFVQGKDIDLLKQSPLFNEECRDICVKNLEKEHAKSQKQLEDDYEKHYHDEVNKIANTFQNVFLELKENEKDLFKGLEAKLSHLQKISLKKAISESILSSWKPSLPENCSFPLATCITSFCASINTILPFHQTLLGYQALNEQEYQDNLKRLSTKRLSTMTSAQNTST